MKAFVTSIGEPTTDLCVWSLQRQGFDVELVQSDSTLGEKLQYIYEVADGDFVRVDADVVVSPGLMSKVEFPPYSDDIWWVQFQTFDMYKMALTHGGVQFIREPALEALRSGINEFLHDDRPETRMWNLEALKRPRRCQTYVYHIAGVHGFGQKDIQRVEQVKTNRKDPDNYDFELAKRMVEFYQ